MANNKSAKKRIRINEKNRLRNKYYKTSIKTLIKLFYSNLNSHNISQNLNKKEIRKDILSSIYSLIDKGTNKKIFHRKTAARKKSRLTTYLKSI